MEAKLFDLIQRIKQESSYLWDLLVPPELQEQYLSEKLKQAQDEFEKAALDEWHEAPEGCVWLCIHCANHSRYRTDVGDEACYLNSILVLDDKPKDVLGMDHRWTKWPVQETVH